MNTKHRLIYVYTHLPLNLVWNARLYVKLV